jgi:cell division protease FtsH
MSQDNFNKPYSDETAKLIDDEVRKLLDKQYQRAQDLLKERRKELDVLAKHLLEREVLLKSDVEKLIGPRPVEEQERIAKNGVIPDDMTTVVDIERMNDSDD